MGFWDTMSQAASDVWTGSGGEALTEGLSETFVEPVAEAAEHYAEAAGVPTAEEAAEWLEYNFGRIKPGEVTTDPKARANVYDQQMRSALAGMRGTESPADTLAKLNLGRVAGAARRGMRRGGGPLSVATGLAAMGPEQARIAAAGGRAVGAEQQRIDQLLGEAYGGADKQSLARAMSEQSRRESIEAAKRGLYDQSRADLNRRIGIAGVMAAPGIGKAYDAASDYLSGLGQGGTWEAQEAARRSAATARGPSGRESVDPTSFGTGTGFA